MLTLCVNVQTTDWGHFEPRGIFFFYHSPKVVYSILLIFHDVVNQLVLNMLQCIRKVFRPLDFFHILLRHSLILNWIK
jgi:hypothetical protein